MRFFLSLLLLIGVVAVVGCGETAVIQETTTDATVLTIKAELGKIVESGDAEMVGEVRSYIEEDLMATDEAKANALLKDLEELQAMTEPEQIKTKAQEMIDKL